MWTRFMDMHSGGGSKEEWEKIYIEAPLGEAEIIFYNKFGHNPNRVTCTCCGPDYSIDESEDLLQATAYDRGCHYDSDLGMYVDRPSDRAFSWSPYKTIDEYIESGSALFIGKDQIDDSDRQGGLPDQGYVWV